MHPLGTFEALLDAALSRGARIGEVLIPNIKGGWWREFSMIDIGESHENCIGFSCAPLLLIPRECKGQCWSDSQCTMFPADDAGGGMRSVLICRDTYNGLN